jgi:catechol 2,3-dioxygenase
MFKKPLNRISQDFRGASRRDSLFVTQTRVMNARPGQNTHMTVGLTKIVIATVAALIGFSVLDIGYVAVACVFGMIAYAMIKGTCDRDLRLHDPLHFHSDGRTPSEVSNPIDSGPRIGHVHLKVADLERALRFYCDVLGFAVTQRFDRQMALISAGGCHHLFGLNTRESEGGMPPPKGTTGLHHVAILYPTRAAFADALQRLVAAKVLIDKVVDHGLSEALYVRDPDGNALELCWERPKKLWPRYAGRWPQRVYAATRPAEPSACHQLERVV